MINIKQFIRIIAVLFTVTIIGEAVVTNQSLNEIKINGPAYNRIVSSKDLIADVLPPPAYIIESYLQINRAMVETDPNEIKKLESNVLTLKGQYEERRQFWAQESLISNEMRNLVTKDSHQHVEQFFKIATDSFFPQRLKEIADETAKITPEEKLAHKAQVKETYNKLSKSYNEHRDVVDKIVEMATKQATQDNLAADQSQSKSIMWVAIGTGVMLLSIYGLLALLVRFAISPLRHVSQELTHGAENTFIAANQVAIASQRLAEGASEQAAAVEETSASLEQISSMIHSTANNATQAKNLSSETQIAARQGASCMAEMTTAMDSIEQSSNEVAKIVKSIDEIAFQTNILALNAAVEAARAGEAGAGFAVVAEEVRSLAQRSAAAAQETADKIEAAILNSRKGSQSLLKVGESFSHIVSKAQHTDSLVAEIAMAAKEQSQGIEHIGTAIEQMSKVTQSTAASSEEIASAAEELSGQAGVHKDLMANLRRFVADNSVTNNAPSHTSEKNVFTRAAAPRAHSTAKNSPPNRAATQRLSNQKSQRRDHDINDAHDEHFHDV
jgi:hypothetical protein